MRKLTTLTAALGAATAIALAFATIPGLAKADDLCGTSVTVDTDLGHSHVCTGDGLVIAAPSITIELGGFTLSGDADSADFGIDNSGGHKGVTIQYGAIEGFGTGVRGDGVESLHLNHLNFSDQTDRGVDVLVGKDVQIKNSSFTMGPPAFLGAEAIRLESVDGVLVQNVDIHGSFVGVNFSCPSPCSGVEPPTNGVVKDSVIHGAFIGVFFANTTDGTAESNHISGGVALPDFGGIPAKGILGQIAPLDPLPTPPGGTVVSGLIIKENHIHNIDGTGIKLEGVTGSEVTQNDVHVNTINGIALLAISIGGPPIGSTGNDIKDNASTGNGGTDLIHDGTSSPNLWENNTCDTDSGADIPTC